MGFPNSKKVAESSKLVAIGVLESVFALGYLFAKQAGRAKRKLLVGGHGLGSSLSSKRLLLLSSCSKPPRRRGTTKNTAPAAAGGGGGVGFHHHDLFDDDDDDDESEIGGAADHKGELWQRSILMGDKCEPLDFSGVIYYDCDGNRVSQLPTTAAAAKSPRPTSSPFAPPPGPAKYFKY